LRKTIKAQILLSGLINFETTLPIERFPLDYFPVTYPFSGVRSAVSGVGYTLAKALTSQAPVMRLCELTRWHRSGTIYGLSTIPALQ
jgi:hypothetical protein